MKLQVYSALPTKEARGLTKEELKEINNLTENGFTSYTMDMIGLDIPYDCTINYDEKKGQLVFKGMRGEKLEVGIDYITENKEMCIEDNISGFEIKEFRLAEAVEIFEGAGWELTRIQF